MTKKITLKDKPEAVRGLNPGRLFPKFWEDECGPFPDANFFKEWDAAKPKINDEFGIVVVFGTSGSQQKEFKEWKKYYATEGSLTKEQFNQVFNPFD